MNIATWNVNGIRARAGQFREWLDRDRPDIVCLQELKAEANQIPEECQSPDYHAYWHTRKGYSGVSLQVRKDLFAVDPVFSHPSFDYESRIVLAELGDLVIASVYVPNGGKDYAAKIDFVNRLIEWSRQQVSGGRGVVVCGDMNIARAEMDVHPKERKPNAIGQRPEERALFATLLESPLVDVGRTLDPDNVNLFTWWAPWRDLRARNIGWRLDYLLASPGLAARATACVVQADVGTSDHAPVVMSTSL
jgi:exodeoxyribonuclease III